MLAAINRIAATLTAAAEELGLDRPAAVCRELTKTFEEVRRGTLGELAEAYDGANVKGEIVLAIAPGTAEAPSEADTDAILAGLVSEMSTGQAASEAARLTGLPRKELYKRLLAMKDGG